MIFEISYEADLWVHRDQSVYAPSRWEMVLWCNGISHWLGTYTEWSLSSCFPLVLVQGLSRLYHMLCSSSLTCMWSSLWAAYCPVCSDTSSTLSAWMGAGCGGGCGSPPCWLQTTRATDWSSPDLWAPRLQVLCHHLPGHLRWALPRPVGLETQNIWMT